MSDFNMPDIQSLVAFGKLGVKMMASRMISLIALFGTIALSAYVVYSPSWQGVVCAGIVACFVFVPALKAESKGATPPAS